LWEKQGGGWERRRSKERGEGRREKGEVRRERKEVLLLQNFKMYFWNMLLIYVIYTNKKKRDRNARKKQLFIEIEFLKIYDKINILKIAISHF
jgi:hypothetical protein